MIVYEKELTHRSDGVRGCDNFSWLRQPIYGWRNELRMLPPPPPVVLICETFAGVQPREIIDPRVDALGDVWLEFRCDVDHRENPVCS